MGISHSIHLGNPMGGVKKRVMNRQQQPQPSAVSKRRINRSALSKYQPFLETIRENITSLETIRENINETMEQHLLDESEKLEQMEKLEEKRHAEEIWQAVPTETEVFRATKYLWTALENFHKILDNSIEPEVAIHNVSKENFSYIEALTKSVIDFTDNFPAYFEKDLNESLKLLKHIFSKETITQYARFMNDSRSNVEACSNQAWIDMRKLREKDNQEIHRSIRLLEKYNEAMQNEAETRKQEGLEALSYIIVALEKFTKLMDNIVIPEGPVADFGSSELYRAAQILKCMFHNHFIPNFEENRVETLKLCEDMFSDGFIWMYHDLIKYKLKDERRAKRKYNKMKKIVEKDNYKLDRCIRLLKQHTKTQPGFPWNEYIVEV